MTRLCLQTGVSQAYWCVVDGTQAKFQPAEITTNKALGQTTAWFDQLLKGGIILPENQSEPVTFLITGPPGSGKTTFALELCYRLARNEHKRNKDSMLSAYISIDTASDHLLDNAVSLGWEDAKRYILKYQGNPPTTKSVMLWGKDQIKNWSTISDIVETALNSLGQWILKTSPEKLTKRLRNNFIVNPITNNSEKISPDILVIDSLNVVEGELQGELFQQFLKATSEKTKIIFFILDSGSKSETHSYWEFVCDTVVRLDYSQIDNYYVRNIEIIKARYQPHVWGKQQLKIYEEFQAPNKNDENHNTRMRRAHPYRKEGGVFIYPSIHYYLSKYKRLSSSEPADFVDSWSKEFSAFVRFPEGRCTAFIGDRGGHKSHLGYTHILHRISKFDEAGLIISLREDEGMTKNTMQQILQQELGHDVDFSKNQLNMLDNADRLEILYFPPGYITPEEFFHRVFMSVHRLKRNNRKLTVLFNSLDQLSARFPLCAKQEIFIPGIIEALSGENITSIFIAVDEQGQPIQQYGLLPMADLILSFSRHQFSFEDYYNHVNEVWNLEHGSLQERSKKLRIQYEGSLREEIVIQVVRFAGGQKGGARGLLELTDANNLENEIFDTPGLHFTKLSHKYDQGLRIK